MEKRSGDVALGAPTCRGQEMRRHQKQDRKDGQGVVEKKQGKLRGESVSKGRDESAC